MTKPLDIEHFAPDTATEPELLAGKITDSEGRRLRALAAKVAAHRAIVELGSYTGKSAACLAVGSAEGNSVKVYAVDLWTTGVGKREYLPNVLAKFTARIEQYDAKGLVVPVMGDTSEVAATFPHSIGLLFIDASHTYEGVKRDFETWSPKVDADGVIAMHDYVRQPQKDQGVRTFVNELQAFDQPWRIVEVVDSMAILRNRDA